MAIPTPAVSAGRCEVEEGSATTVCALPVGVEGLGNQNVTVAFATANGTATSLSADYETAGFRNDHVPARHDRSAR